MMADVKPLADDHNAPVPTRPAPRRRVEREAPAPASAFAVRDHAAPVAADEHLDFARSGPQHKLLRRLRRGELDVEARLDLHGCTLPEAGDRLAHFLQAASDSGRRCVLVVHGKGHRSEAGQGVLKSQVNQWLRNHPAVLAFSSAQPRDGGTGALYLLLRSPSPDR